MNIPVEHPDAGDPLLESLRRVLEGWGARVCIAVDAENLIRRLRPPSVGHASSPRPSGLPDKDARDGAPVAEICAQGLPNLLHEFVHVVLAQRLDDDHGIDYQAIPFDLETATGRRVLFEELACCVTSCAYLSRSQVGGRAAESPACTKARVDAWFAEQIEIQPVFYGMEADPSGFWDRVETVSRAHRRELERVHELAYARCEAALLRWAHAPEVARPAARLGLHELLCRQGRKGIA